MYPQLIGVFILKPRIWGLINITHIYPYPHAGISSDWYSPHTKWHGLMVALRISFWCTACWFHRSHQLVHLHRDFPAHLQQSLHSPRSDSNRCHLEKRAWTGEKKYCIWSRKKIQLEPVCSSSIWGALAGNQASNYSNYSNYSLSSSSNYK